MDKNKEETPNISGSFQMVADDRKESIEELRKNNKLDEETEYYARLFGGLKIAGPRSCEGQPNGRHKGFGFTQELLVGQGTDPLSRLKTKT